MSVNSERDPRAAVSTGRPKSVERAGDKVFKVSARSAGIFILAILAAVSAFLLVEGAPASPEQARETILAAASEVLGQRLALWRAVAAV